MPQKQIQYPNVHFMTDVIWPRFAGEHPDAAAMCYPRRIVPPYGYLNPKVYSTEMLCLMKDNQRLVANDDSSLAWCAIITKMLLQYEVPTYFIDRDFLKAVYESDPPDCRVSDIHWPMPAMLFVMPMDTMQELTGGFHFPFLACANVPTGVYEVDNSKLTTMRCPSRTITDIDRFIFHFPGFFPMEGGDPDLVPVDFVASYRTSIHITELAKFEDFVDWTAAYPEALKPVGQPTHEQELAINKTINSLAAKLLLAITACPNAIEKGARLWPKNAPKPGQLLAKSELHSPNFIGRRYSVSRPNSGESVPTGKIVPAHWRRGHFQWTPVGPKSQVYSVANMPHNHALTNIDWAKCTPDQIKLFKETHQLDWIPKIRVNEDLEKK